MATTIRPELSEKNPYWIEKHRYYELKHFCLQYPIWQKQYSLISNTRSNEAYSLTPIANQSFYDSTGETAVDRTYYSLRIRIAIYMRGCIFTFEKEDVKVEDGFEYKRFVECPDCGERNTVSL